MDKILKNFIWLSNAIGRDKELAVGTGGNTSAKTDDKSCMYIKASGTALADVSNERGWRKVNTKAVLDLMTYRQLLEMNAIDRETAMAKRLVDVCIDSIGNEPRPSVESTLHAFMGKYGVHLHALPSLAYVCAKNGEQMVHELFTGKTTKPLWVPYSNPGFDLGVIVKEYYDKYVVENSKVPEIMFFEKHGMMVCTDDAVKTFELTKEVIQIFQNNLGEIPGNVANMPKENLVNGVIEKLSNAFEKTAKVSVNINYYINPLIELYFTKSDAEELISKGPLTPDEIGFIENPVIVERTQINELDAILAKEKKNNDNLPNIILVKGIGLFIIGNQKFADIVKEVFSSSLYVRHFASKMGGLNILTGHQQNFVRQWEGEKYRVQQALKL